MIAACSSARMESHWQSQPISVDGNGSDWGDLALDYNEEMDIVYGAANDSENLLLTLRFRDARLAQLGKAAPAHERGVGNERPQDRPHP